MDNENAELVTVDQSLYDSVRNPLAGLLMGGAGNYLLNLDSATMALIGQNSSQQLSTVCTQQFAFDQVTAATLAAAAAARGTASGSGSSSAQSSSHAPLNATNTMKPSASNSSSSSVSAAAAAAAASTTSPRKTTVSNLSGN